MKKILVMTLVALMLAGSLFAQGGKEAAATEASDGKITLTVWQDNTTPDRQAHLDKTVADYMATHPNVEVKVTSLPNSAADKMMVAFAANQGPDIYFSSGPEVSDWVEAGYIIPLDDYVEKSFIKDRLLPQSIEDVRSKDITGQNKIWYLPLGTAFYVLWVRPDWINAVGGKADSWDNLFDAIPKMTDKSKDQYGLAIRGGKGSVTFLERMMYSYSGIDSVFIDGKCTINDPKNLEFVERYSKMYNVYTAEGDLNYGWTELSAAFDSGSAGVIIHNLGSGENHVKAFNNDLTKFEAVPLPVGPYTGKITTQFQQEAGLVISKTCKNPDAAFELGSYLATGASVSGFDRMYGLVPVDKEVLANDAWIKDLPWYDMASKAMLSDNIVFYNYYSWIPGKNKVYQDLVPDFQQVLVGKLSAKDFLDDWAGRFQKLYDEYYATKK